MPTHLFTAQSHGNRLTSSHLSSHLNQPLTLPAEQLQKNLHFRPGIPARPTEAKLRNATCMIQKIFYSAAMQPQHVTESFLHTVNPSHVTCKGVSSQYILENPMQLFNIPEARVTSFNTCCKLSLRFGVQSGVHARAWAWLSDCTLPHQL